MLKPPSRRRSSERGQTLILALAFIAFFGLVVVAVLRVGDVTSLQHVHTETTAVTNAGAEGGTALAAADAGRSGLALLCSVNNTGQIVMTNTDTAKYTVNACNPGQTGVGIGPAPGSGCILCLLNVLPAPQDATASILDLHCAQCTTADLTTNGGDVYLNGSIAKSSDAVQLIASPTSSTHIRLLSGATYPNGCCQPAPAYFAPAIGDPLAAVGAPPTKAGMPSGCTSWDPVKGCSANFSSKGTSVINPGLWSSISVTGQADIQMTPGLYVFTGTFSMSGRGNLTTGPAAGGETGITFFLTCPEYGSTATGKLCASGGEKGASLSFGGSGSISITSPASQYSANDLAVLSDANLLDPGGGGSCANGGTCVLSASGQAASISGTVDTRMGGVSLQANSGTSISGRLIANSLSMSVTGKIGSGLSLSGATGVGTNPCGVFDVNVSGTTAGVASSTGRSIVESQCGAGLNRNGVVFFNYTP